MAAHMGFILEPLTFIEDVPSLLLLMVLIMDSIIDVAFVDSDKLFSFGVVDNSPEYEQINTFRLARIGHAC